MSINSKAATAVGAASAVAALSIIAAAAPAGAAGVSGYRPLAGSTAPFASQRPAGAMAASTHLTIQVWLKPRLAAAQAYAGAVSAPGTARFHRYLSPSGYAAAFGPSRAQAAAVEAWLRSQGFAGVRADAGRDYVRATGAVSRVDAAFRTRIMRYHNTASVNAGPYQLYANARPVSVPAALAGSVLGVTGLNNAAPILPLAYPKYSRAPAQPGPRIPCSHYYGQHYVNGVPPYYGRRVFPSELCGYSASQMRRAYGASASATGKGRTIALVELGLAPQMFLTLQDYAKANHMPAPSPSRYAELALGNGSACGDPFYIEEQLDVEASYDMAPGANQLVVGGDACNFGDYGLQGLFNADIAVLNGVGNHPLASVASNSWGSGYESQPPLLTNIEHAFLVRAAAEGVGMYFSSGDGSSTFMPGSDPFAISVGGTTLALGKGSVRLFETGWSNGVNLIVQHRWRSFGEFGAAGGGPSLIWRQPGYQRGVVPAALAQARGNLRVKVRSVPDISADADPYTGFLEGIVVQVKKKLVYQQFDIGGTSLAAPLVAGLVTAAEQGQHESFGFINPVLYRLAKSKAFHDALPITRNDRPRHGSIFCDAHTCGIELLITIDDQAANLAGYFGQVTLRGYDNMTGIGTPNGPVFISALRRL